MLTFLPSHTYASTCSHVAPVCCLSYTVRPRFSITHGLPGPEEAVFRKYRTGIYT